MGALLLAVAIFISAVFVGEGTRRQSEKKKMKAEIVQLRGQLEAKP